MTNDELADRLEALAQKLSVPTMGPDVYELQAIADEVRALEPRAGTLNDDGFVHESDLVRCPVFKDRPELRKRRLNFDKIAEFVEAYL
jgi:hypothetical protein